MKWNPEDSLTSSLTTTPNPGLGIILVTGATGYVGGRLTSELLGRGYTVRIMARVEGEEYKVRWPEAEIVVADALHPEQLNEALREVHTAYYLIHSRITGPKPYEETDIQAARNFKRAAEMNGIKHLIYLGSLGEEMLAESNLDKHPMVSLELQSSKYHTTILRTTIIIGSGSAPYEILESLVKKVPIFFLPGWTRARCQPVSIRSLVSSMVGALEAPLSEGGYYEVGGPDVTTLEEMIRVFSDILGTKKMFFPGVVTSMKLYAYAGSLVTPVSAGVIRPFLENFHHDVVCHEDHMIPESWYRPIPLKEGILRAMSREERDEVATRWADEFPRAHELSIKLSELEKPPHYVSPYSIISKKSAASLFASVCKIGGEEGWLHANWMWRIRGLLDALFLGVGISRGRRSSTTLRVNDAVDFWRVEEIIKNGKLLLRAEMKLPGKAWLEFNIHGEDDGNRLTVTPYFEPKGLIGKIYWYIFLPFHYIIFTNLIKKIDARS